MLSPNKTKRWSHTEKLYVGFLGKIAAGKSKAVDRVAQSLREDRPDDRIKTYPEYVPQKLFDNYMKDPDLYAEPFQSMMAAFAATRDFWAHDFLKDFPTGTAISERPLPENLIFFLNNLSLGHIHEKYRQNYEDGIEQFHPYRPDLMVYLHVSDRRSVHRMFQRAGVIPERISEKEYDKQYLKLLGHKYFDWLIQHISQKREPPILVVDWNIQADPDSQPEEYRLLIEGLLDKIEAFLVAGCPVPDIKLESLAKPSDPLASSTGDLDTCFVKKHGDEVMAMIPVQMAKMHDYVLEQIAAGHSMTLYC
jgi:deoxyadenosine/deoxycytidine kinase